MVVSVVMVVMVAAASGPAPVVAPPPAAANEAGRLFDKARAAFKANNFAEACPAFEQSYSLEPALGTLLNLGACLEKQGHFASAWLRYNDAIGWAQRTHETDREDFARKLSNTVKPKVSWLVISASEDVDVKLDTRSIHVTPTAISLPIDPGLHALLAEKPGSEKWAASIDIAQPGTTNVQKIPQLKPHSLSSPPPPPLPMPLADAKMEPVPWSAPPAPPSDLTRTPEVQLTTVAPAQQRTGKGGATALMVSGGVVAVAGAVGLAWSAVTYGSLQNQRINVLPPDQYVSRADYEALKWVYPVSWVAVGAGAAAVVGGAILAATKHPVTVTPSVGPGVAAMTVSGQF